MGACRNERAHLGPGALDSRSAPRALAQFARDVIDAAHWAERVDADGFRAAIKDPGQTADKESGLHYFRSYSPGIWRYTQTDPIGLDGGWNVGIRFSYVDSNPLRSRFSGRRSYDRSWWLVLRRCPGRGQGIFSTYQAPFFTLDGPLRGTSTPLGSLHALPSAEFNSWHVRESMKRIS